MQDGLNTRMQCARRSRCELMEVDASRYHGKAPDEIDWSVPERRTQAVAEFLGALDDEDPTPISSCQK